METTAVMTTKVMGTANILTIIRVSNLPDIQKTSKVTKII